VTRERVTRDRVPAERAGTKGHEKEQEEEEARKRKRKRSKRGGRRGGRDEGSGTPTKSRTF
jgi:hypothetical protein